MQFISSSRFNILYFCLLGIFCCESFSGNEYSFLHQIVIPVGLSFYTFQSIAYTVDVYRGRSSSGNEFLQDLLCCFLLPQLVAGPVERFKQLKCLN